MFPARLATEDEGRDTPASCCRANHRKRDPALSQKPNRGQADRSTQEAGQRANPGESRNPVMCVEEAGLHTGGQAEQHRQAHQDHIGGVLGSPKHQAADRNAQDRQDQNRYCGRGPEQQPPGLAQRREAGPVALRQHVGADADKASADTQSGDEPRQAHQPLEQAQITNPTRAQQERPDLRGSKPHDNANQGAAAQDDGAAKDGLHDVRTTCSKTSR